MILGLFTRLLDPGGVQRFGLHSGAVLFGLAQDSGIPYKILSLNDPKGTHRLHVGKLEFIAQGFGKSKVGFTLAALKMLPVTQLAYIGHPNIAHLGLPLRFVSRKARYWIAAHGIEVWDPLPFLPRMGLHEADGVTVPSNYTREKMAIAQGLDPNKIIVLAPGLDPKFMRMNWAAAHHQLRAHSGKVILTVARLTSSERSKGIGTVIRALPNVIKAISDVRYVVVGDGNDVECLQALAQEVGVADRVLFVGSLVDDDLVAEYREADIFVMPSRK